MAFEKGGLISATDMNEFESYTGNWIISTPVIGTRPIELNWIPPGTIGDDSKEFAHYIKMAPKAIVQLGVGRYQVEGASWVKIDTKLNSEIEWTDLITPDDGELAQYYNDSTEFAEVRIRGHYVDEFGPQVFIFKASVGGYGNPAVENELIRVINPNRDGYVSAVVTRTLANEGRLGV